MKIIQAKALKDNYAYLLICQNTKAACVIDVPDANLILNLLKTHDANLVAILNTHHHWDHADENVILKKEFPHLKIYCSEYDFQKKRIPMATDFVKEGDQISIGNLDFKVLDTVGHTLGHVSYYSNEALFCGDTVFVSGCGRLFEGTSQMMFETFQKLKKLPEQTQIYCAHEYSYTNLRFAKSLFANDKNILKKYDKIKNLTEENRPTVPTTLKEELLTNPFFLAKSHAEFKNYRKIRDDFL